MCDEREICITFHDSRSHRMRGLTFQSLHFQSLVIEPLCGQSAWICMRGCGSWAFTMWLNYTILGFFISQELECFHQNSRKRNIIITIRKWNKYKRVSPASQLEPQIIKDKNTNKVNSSVEQNKHVNISIIQEGIIYSPIFTCVLGKGGSV